MKVIITLPAYNEKKTIGRVISDIKQAMDSTKYNYRILVVDDGSNDGTGDIAKRSGAIVHSHPANYGLAETFKTEMRKCLELGADIIVHTDADGQYIAKDIPKLIKEVEDGNDLVLGSRFKGKIEYMPFIKRLGNRAFSKVVSKITKKKISDSQTGFRAFTKEVAGSINIISSFTYTQEQIIKASRHKFKIKEVPIYFAKRDGKSKLMKNPFDFAVKAWINLLRIYRDYEPLKFFCLIGGIFFLTGFTIGLWLLYIFTTTGVIGHVPSALLSVLLILIGIQIFFFGFLADMNRK
ncbi:glycosyl transferase family 2 [Candidatus Woesearchaeota archaeon]|jgi:glycosyltransferase involved in cell wall biosynthesis|nr:glycosyl transferase family 2 [Candidatus Woesearchaeota archaeon]|tara:strand:+ start:7948 stop:8829 length:882 start_codon:yes stop_codon:yes gene_type:complete